MAIFYFFQLLSHNFEGKPPGLAGSGTQSDLLDVFMHCRIKVFGNFDADTEISQLYASADFSHQNFRVSGFLFQIS